MQRTLLALITLGASSLNPVAASQYLNATSVTTSRDQTDICIDIFRKAMDSGETGIDKTLADGVTIKVLEGIPVTNFWERNGSPRGTAEWIFPKKFNPKRSKNKKRILFLHGGGYTQYSPSDFYRPLTTRLAVVADMPVLAIDYRLVPEFLFPGGLEDALLGLKYVWENGLHGPEEAEHVYVVGDSAGAGLALSLELAIISGTLDGKKPIITGVKQADAAVLVSSYTDLSCSLPSYESRVWVEKTKTGDPIFSSGNSKEDLISSINAGWRYIGRNTGFTLKNEIASPYWARDEWLAKLPPMQLMVGDAELMLDDTVVFAEKVVKAGGPKAEVLVYPRMWHDHLFYTAGCENKPNSLPPAVDAYIEWGRYLKNFHP